MSLNEDVTAALPGLRAEAESLMVDTCRVTAGGSIGSWNDTTGTYTPASGATVYEGKCRLRKPSAAPRDVDSGEAGWAVDEFVLSLPVAGSESVENGHSVEILTSDFDTALVGLLLEVTGGHWQTHSTARRLLCKVVSRDA